MPRTGAWTAFDRLELPEPRRRPRLIPVHHMTVEATAVWLMLVPGAPPRICRGARLFGPGRRAWLWCLLESPGG